MDAGELLRAFVSGVGAGCAFAVCQLFAVWWDRRMAAKRAVAQHKRMTEILQAQASSIVGGSLGYNGAWDDLANRQGRKPHAN